MSSLYLTDEDIHGCEENDTEILLRSRLDKANERIEELEDIIKSLKNKINKDIEINNICLEENTDYFVKQLIAIWTNYNKELLEILSDKK